MAAKLHLMNGRTLTVHGDADGLGKAAMTGAIQAKTYDDNVVTLAAGAVWMVEGVRAVKAKTTFGFGRALLEEAA